MQKNSPSFTTERREYGRVILQQPCLIQLDLRGGGTLHVRLENISAIGVRLSLPDNCGANSMPGNTPVTLSSFPEPLDILENTYGIIAWVVDGVCGVHFLQPLTLPREKLAELALEAGICIE